ncbi:hypothetical protein F1559_002872 [Cyanidiococcus yangmingshanensis]|uniref:AAA+ ATPase domain-containing protein n=1 Tax=Cyanidiococcus yangmingshanensis TaxID=2690220 RepID=A0A7J7IKW5_9RHOD|nr:hypothetical protein F1559_002872 [Cyanidiococcus yangmingshanensis]
MMRSSTRIWSYSLQSHRSAEAVEAQLVAVLLKFWENPLQGALGETNANLKAWHSSDFVCVHQYQDYWLRRIENEWIASVQAGASLCEREGFWLGSVRSLEPGCADYADRVVLEWALSTDAPAQLDASDVLFVSVMTDGKEGTSARCGFPAVRLTRTTEPSLARNVVTYGAWIPHKALGERMLATPQCRLWRAFVDEHEWRAGLMPFQRQFMAVTRLGQIYRPLMHVLVQPAQCFSRQRCLPDYANTETQALSRMSVAIPRRELTVSTCARHEDSLSDALNASQSRAVTCILRSRPGDVTLVVGPPGTGKTSTIVAALIRLVDEEPTPRILVCAPSNNTVRLLLAEFRQRTALSRTVKVAWLQAQSQRQRPTGAASREDAKRHENAHVEESSVKDAEIVFVTLNSAAGLGVQGTGLMNERAFQYIIVDEASQAVEPDTLIPLILYSLIPGDRCLQGSAGAKTRSPGRLILVGDARQLPATVRSRWNQLAGYEKSLFERLCEAAERTNYAGLCWLEEQYRMHPSIAAFPSHFFYANRLRTAPQAQLSALAEESPVHLIDLSDDASHREIRVGTSLANPYEANRLVGWLAEYAVKLANSEKPQWSVLLLTPYRAQVSYLEDGLRRRKLISESATESNGIPDKIEYRVSTIDGAQGAEADVVILSPVRSARRDNSTNGVTGHGNIGFVADTRRLNVALTRARFMLVFGGDLATLASCSCLYAAWFAFLCRHGIVSDSERFCKRLKTFYRELESDSVAAVETPSISASPRAGVRSADDADEHSPKRRARTSTYSCPVCRLASARIAAAMAYKRPLDLSQGISSSGTSPTARLPATIASSQQGRIKRSQKDARVAAARAEEAASRLVQSDNDDDESTDSRHLLRGFRSYGIRRQRHDKSRPHCSHLSRASLRYSTRSAPELDAPGRAHGGHVSVPSRLRQATNWKRAGPALQSPNDSNKTIDSWRQQGRDSASSTYHDAHPPSSRVRMQTTMNRSQGPRMKQLVLSGPLDRFRERRAPARSVARESTAVQRFAARFESQETGASGTMGVTSVSEMRRIPGGPLKRPFMAATDLSDKAYGIGDVFGLQSRMTSRTP